MGKIPPDLTWIEKYRRIPFKEKGRDFSGVDCWGLVTLTFWNERKILLPSYLECYETTNDRGILAKLIAEERGNWIDPETPEYFDVIIAKMRGEPMHVGIVTKPGHMLHCARGANVVHEPFTSIKWKDNVIGFARYKF